jgi:prepilin-type processing-associated H-X9-DG protein
VAASLFLCLSLLIPPLVGYLHAQDRRYRCQNNERVAGEDLLHYASEHKDRFPNAADPNLAPRNRAGIFVPVLYQEEGLNSFTTRCPGNGPPAHCQWSVPQLKGMSNDEFEKIAPQLSRCYAYTLGFKKDAAIEGLCCDGFPMPIMSDRPPRGDQLFSSDNSPNHGGTGQNVLFTDGHVEFLTKRTIAGDDIYLNRFSRVAPGQNSRDAVLAVSETRLPMILANRN